MICCHLCVRDYQRWEEVRLVATNVCLMIKDDKKYDLLPAICA